MKKVFVGPLHIHEPYRKIPTVFSEQTPKLFGTATGFDATEIRITGGDCCDF